MKVYLDCCCYCRRYDISDQKQVIAEVDAISAIYCMHEFGFISIAGSEALNDEISCISDPVKRKKVLSDYYNVDEIIGLSDSINLRSIQIQERSNIRMYDSLHIASAEEACAAVMLTTDYKLIKMASRIDLKVKVMNPRSFIFQYMNGGDI
ncbi:MAG: hypothetical protein LUH23_09915 [Oscillospiraceae bacterium]|nr:hypothetical protein [Oscillospiraceae bacterium]